ncbi:CPBP family intramembrane metalloprotease [Patescibacteria group bacterium]|nr:CPBP family intramembrane metalloprotease [Patescibacteria group bacterium]
MNKSKNLYFYLAVVPALVFQFVGAYFYLVAYEGTEFAQIFYTCTKLLLVIWPLIWIYWLRSRFLPFFRGDVRRSLVMGAVSGVVIFLGAGGLYFLMADFLGSFGGKIALAAQGLGILEHYILFSIFLSVGHSFIEEYYWRWFVLNGLMMKMGRSAAIVVGSLAFASHHFIVVIQFAPLHLTIIATAVIFLLGVYWSKLYLDTKSIAGSWLSHFMADAIVMGIGYFLIAQSGLFA